jgi:ubiquinone/menaquinone biosynthesis C-methylase UbiE
VLVVGCGSGISACKIAKMFGCRILGIDLSRAMVEVSSIVCNLSALREPFAVSLQLCLAVFSCKRDLRTATIYYMY